LRKRGGNLKMTRIKKIDGDRQILRDELKTLLKSEDCVINSITGHIMIKGHHKPTVEKFLRERMF
jgi:large subunit ribosomal protein L49